MDCILSEFERLEKNYQELTKAGDYEKRYNLVEEARQLYGKLRPVEQITLRYAYPQWSMALQPNLI